MKTVLTIAGSDCSGGAGIQADLKTIAAHGLYGESVITALTAQNTLGVAEVVPVSPDFLERQLECVFTDIPPDAVKIGMIPGREQMRVIRDILKKYQAEHIVMDTVMVSTSGKTLMEPEALTYYKQELLPLAEIYTPNLPEAELLLKTTIKTKEERVAAGKEFGLQYKGSVYLKGGHDLWAADDLLFDQGKMLWMEEVHIENPNTHGTGCTLSSAIACGLAQGYGVEKSVRNAKQYITGAIADGLDLGKGNGPLNHMYRYAPVKGTALD
ncbi:MAG: bifunctional hydroxymethylpyrimidine kinase/phosphomethylpyrimidine kinase [Lachnospiraceae bacterium]|nr:bifunctional hydroxymethylpyrimidine kinase/phosphomethylpyrimidine kinase [Lachnospiraceae bacterium]